jgi:cell division protein FtsA
LEPLASADAVLEVKRKRLEFALVILGVEPLIYFKDGIIRHTAVIPFGDVILMILRKDVLLLKSKPSF